MAADPLMTPSPLNLPGFSPVRTNPLMRPAPRWATPRRPDRPTWGGEIALIAEQFGQPFMPWQRFVADVAGEYDPVTGQPYYREVIVTVPRQSGKTTLFVGCQCHRCLSPRWREPQRSVYTAQSGKDARDKWLDEIFPMLEHSALGRFIRRINRGMGNESLLWVTGGIIRIMPTSEKSGHSKTLHQGVTDEIWADTDDRREQSIRPAMITVPDAQLLVCSTAGKETSVVLKRKRKTGRAAVAEGLDRHIAYFEWSAPVTQDSEGRIVKWDPHTDFDALLDFHPAICPDPPCRCGDGKWRHTQTLDTIRSEFTSMALGEFVRAYGNLDSEEITERVIDEDAWQACQKATARVVGPNYRIGIDASDDRDAAALAMADGKVVEIVDYRPGVGWLIDRAVEVALKWDATVAIDKEGPIGYMAEDLAEKGVKLDAMQPGEVVQSCGRMYDDIADCKVTFTQRGEFWPDLNAAVRGLETKPAGDRTVWSRSTSSAEISPFYAATLAWKPNMPEGAFML
jgi:hypothetical protein